MYTNNELNDLMLKVNRICFGDRFKTKFVETFKYLPTGLTYHIEDINNQLCFTLMIKYYGYESSVNNGISEFSDAYDFDVGHRPISDEIKEFVKDYFFHYEPVFYNEYMKTANIM